MKKKKTVDAEALSTLKIFLYMAKTEEKPDIEALIKLIDDGNFLKVSNAPARQSKSKADAAVAEAMAMFK